MRTTLSSLAQVSMLRSRPPYVAELIPDSSNPIAVATIGPAHTIAKAARLGRAYSLEEQQHGRRYIAILVRSSQGHIVYCEEL